MKKGGTFWPFHGHKIPTSSRTISGEEYLKPYKTEFNMKHNMKHNAMKYSAAPVTICAPVTPIAPAAPIYPYIRRYCPIYSLRL